MGKEFVGKERRLPLWGREGGYLYGEGKEVTFIGKSDFPALILLLYSCLLFDLLIALELLFIELMI